MFYVSCLSPSGLIGVTDTNDGVEEFYKNNEIVSIIESKKAKIFGVSVFNHKAEPTALTIDRVLDVYELENRINAWRKLHNPWSGKPVECYLAEAQIGTAINVAYRTQATGGRWMNGVTRLVRLSYDEWYFYDPMSTANKSTGDSSFAASCLEVACIYSKPEAMSIAWGVGKENFRKTFGIKE